VSHHILIFLQVGFIELFFNFDLLLVALHVLLIGKLRGVASTLLLDGCGDGLSLVELIKHVVVGSFLLINAGLV
jgi:hypothetical protein